MSERLDDPIFVKLTTSIKDLIRLRAARERKSMSDYARDLILAGLGSPTADEAVFLGLETHQNETLSQNGESHA